MQTTAQTTGDKHRVKAGGISVAVLVARQRPSTDPERTYIDHAEGNLLNDTFANLHWVTPAFNTWNRDQKEQDGYFGVYRNGRNKKSISVIFREVGQGSYDNAETAARVYDLVVRLAYKDQVDKTPHLLNNLPDQDKHVVKVESRADGVDIYPVDHYHVLIYDGNVESKHDTLGEAERAAKTFISSREYEELKNWVIRQNERKIPVYQNAITRNADNVAFLPMKLAKNTSVEVLMDDSTWLDLVSASVTLFRGFGNRAMLKLDGKTEFLSRFLRPAGNDIVDHVNRNVLDHRLANLEVRDRSANSQNARRGLGFSLVSRQPRQAAGSCLPRPRAKIECLARPLLLATLTRPSSSMILRLSSSMGLRPSSTIQRT